MPRPTNVGVHGTAGLLLLAGFAFLVVAALLYGFGTYPLGTRLQNNFLGVGLVLTLFGLAAFQFVLSASGDHLLARLGMIAYLVGVVLWLVGETLAVDSGRFIFEFERDYVVLACLATAMFGSALLLKPILPRWVGGSAVAWALLWAVLYLTRIAEAPLGPNLATALFGVELLVHRPNRSAEDKTG